MQLTTPTATIHEVPVTVQGDAEGKIVIYSEPGKLAHKLEGVVCKGEATYRLTWPLTGDRDQRNAAMKDAAKWCRSIASGHTAGVPR
jgi:hypothetical protein